MSNTQSIEKGNEPFSTTDAELALALLTAGCQFASGKDGGPALNHYTPEVCRNRWVTVRDADGFPIRVPLLSHKPVTPEQFEVSVMRAERMKIPGNVTYCILRDSTFTEAMKAHDAMVDECAKAARDNREPVIPTLNTLTETALIMVICYVRRRNRAMMESHIWMRSPLLTTGDAKKEVKPIEGASKETLEQMSYTQSGNGKTWSLNLSDKARATVMGDNKPFLHPKPRL